MSAVWYAVRSYAIAAVMDAASTGGAIIVATMSASNHTFAGPLSAA